MDGETIDPNGLIDQLATTLVELCNGNDHVCRIGKDAFAGQSKPAISVRDYIKRIAKYAGCSEECFVLALIYIDRLTAVSARNLDLRCRSTPHHYHDSFDPPFAVTWLNVHRVLVTAVMISAKFFDDHYYNNEYYAKIAGLSLQEMNKMETEMLFGLNFHLSIKPDKFWQIQHHLVALLSNRRRHEHHMELGSPDESFEQSQSMQSMSSPCGSPYSSGPSSPVRQHTPHHQHTHPPHQPQQQLSSPLSVHSGEFFPQQQQTVPIQQPIAQMQISDNMVISAQNIHPQSSQPQTFTQSGTVFYAPQPQAQHQQMSQQQQQQQQQEQEQQQFVNQTASWPTGANQFAHQHQPQAPPPQQFAASQFFYPPAATQQPQQPQPPQPQFGAAQR